MGSVFANPVKYRERSCYISLHTQSDLVKSLHLEQTLEEEKSMESTLHKENDLVNSLYILANSFYFTYQEWSWK